MKRIQAFLILCGLLGGVPAMAADVPVLVPNEKGDLVEKLVPRQQYSQRVLQMMRAAHESTLPALKNLREHPGWKLRTVLVGVGLDVSAGLPLLMTLDVAPRFRLAFSNEHAPAMP